MSIAMACLLLTGCGTEAPDPEPEPVPAAPTASPTAPSEGISRDDAIEAARDAAGDMVAEEWEVGSVTAGPVGHFMLELEHLDWARDLPGDLRVWRVNLVSGDLGAVVVMDFVDGSVYGVVVGIAN